MPDCCTGFIRVRHQSDGIGVGGIGEYPQRRLGNGGVMPADRCAPQVDGDKRDPRHVAVGGDHPRSRGEGRRDHRESDEHY